MVKNNVLVAGTAPEESKSENNKKIYKDLLAAISKLDTSTKEGYKAADALIDIENYITYMAGIAYIDNTDYRANFTLWRTAEKGGGEYEDARWRWIYQDLDDCCAYHLDSPDMITYLTEDVMFSSLWKNSAFQTKFLTRIMDFANVELTPEYIREFITPILTYYNPYLKETYIRFQGKNSCNSKTGKEGGPVLLPFPCKIWIEIGRNICAV